MSIHVDPLSGHTGLTHPGPSAVFSHGHLVSGNEDKPGTCKLLLFLASNTVSLSIWFSKTSVCWCAQPCSQLEMTSEKVTTLKAFHALAASSKAMASTHRPKASKKSIPELMFNIVRVTPLWTWSWIMIKDWKTLEKPDTGFVLGQIDRIDFGPTWQARIAVLEVIGSWLVWSTLRVYVHFGLSQVLSNEDSGGEFMFLACLGFRKETTRNQHESVWECGIPQ